MSSRELRNAYERERDYYADPERECFIAVHLSLRGAEDLANAVGMRDAFGRELFTLVDEIRAERGQQEDER